MSAILHHGHTTISNSKHPSSDGSVGSPSQLSHKEQEALDSRGSCTNFGSSGALRNPQPIRERDIASSFYAVRGSLFLELATLLVLIVEFSLVFWGFGAAGFGILLWRTLLVAPLALMSIATLLLDAGVVNSLTEKQNAPEQQNGFITSMFTGCCKPGGAEAAVQIEAADLEAAEMFAVHHDRLSSGKYSVSPGEMCCSAVIWTETDGTLARLAFFNAANGLYFFAIAVYAAFTDDNLQPEEGQSIVQPAHFVFATLIPGKQTKWWGALACALCAVARMLLAFQFNRLLLASRPPQKGRQVEFRGIRGNRRTSIVALDAALEFARGGKSGDSSSPLNRLTRSGSKDSGGRASPSALSPSMVSEDHENEDGDGTPPARVRRRAAPESGPMQEEEDSAEEEDDVPTAATSRERAEA